MSTWHQAIGALRRELRDYVVIKVADIFLWSRTANASALGKEDAVETADDDPNGGQRPARRIEPFGFRSRPVAKQRCLSLKLGSSTVFYIGIASDGGYGPNDLDDGEVALYNKVVGTTVVLDKDGNVTINVPDGANVNLGGDGLTASQNGVVLGSGIDPFTGSTYYSLQSASDVVLAKKA